jgi:Concanavalin A-like lectin/glucanases superfamily
MKRILAITLLAALVASLPAAEVFRLNFDNADGVVTFPYTAGTGDIIGGATIDTDDPFVPDLFTAPSFATNATAPTGDSAVLTCAPSANDGLCITLGSALSGDFAIEVLFMIPQYGTTADGVEHGLMTVVGSTDWENSATGRGLGFRIWPNGTQGALTGTGQIQLNCHNGTAETNSSLGPTVTLNVWHHAVASYNNSTGDVSFYYDGGLVETINPAYGGSSATQEYGLGVWMSTAGTDRSLIGDIDAFVIHDAQVAPGTFSLPVELSVFSSE